jgi:carbon-monoxide dehydrogenase small subunit
MTPIRLIVNGRPVVEAVEARTHLADFLRDRLNLTATHLRCEQGVCGACTLLIDGQPARSCITYAVMCEGAAVTTLEGLEHDPAMAALRRAFAEEHGLQCGFCTPGMLITARDIVTRLPDADAARIRLELSGNLCRCTGYVGIVRAIERVLKARRAGTLAAPPMPAPALGPVGARRVRAAPEHRVASAARSAAPLAGEAAAQGVLGLAGRQPNIELRQSFLVARPPGEVWNFLGNLEQVARCLPGASLSGAPQAGNVAGKFAVKLGPITASFSGEARIVRDDAQRRALLLGAGSDRLSGSRAAGEIEYVVLPAGGGSRVEIVLRAILAGALAQFGRSGIVEDLVARIAETFARNLEAKLAGGGAKPKEPENAPLAAGALLRQVLSARVRAIFARWLGRGSR